jgi:hypothetical protein
LREDVVIDTEQIRRLVATDEDPFKSACGVVGAMIGVMEAIYGKPIALLFLQTFVTAIEVEAAGLAAPIAAHPSTETEE